MSIDLSADRNRAFELFRKSYQHTAVIEENKALLKQRCAGTPLELLRLLCFDVQCCLKPFVHIATLHHWLPNPNTAPLAFVRLAPCPMAPHLAFLLC